MEEDSRTQPLYPNKGELPLFFPTFPLKARGRDIPGNGLSIPKRPDEPGKILV